MPSFGTQVLDPDYELRLKILHCNAETSTLYNKLF